MAAAQPQSCSQPPPLPPEPCKALSRAPEGFDPIDAPELISQAKKGPGKGGVCDARAFRVNGTPTIYRAYNGTNPSSKLGEWWALEEPSGPVSAYRRDYQICYQWSPLDRLVKCTLRVGTKVVLGTGQSAACSEYLSYSTSASVQLYLADAKADAVDCAEFDAIMSWEQTATKAPRSLSTGGEAVSTTE